MKLAANKSSLKIEAEKNKAYPKKNNNEPKTIRLKKVRNYNLKFLSTDNRNVCKKISCFLINLPVPYLLNVINVSKTGLTIATNKIRPATISKCGKYKKTNSPNCEILFQFVTW